MSFRGFAPHFGIISIRLRAWLAGFFLIGAGASMRAELVGHWTFEAEAELVDLTGNWGELELRGATVADGHLNLGSNEWALAQSYTGPTIREKTLVTWLRMEDLNVRNGAPLAIDHPTSDRFDAIVFAERQPLRWMPGSSGFQRTQDVMSFDETELEPELVQVAITYADAN
ncbi:MAG: hypothetical protein GWO24_29560, partial [Akkermansiaceae bacterium]|nr:hypothetical protein [Akkermansiaceae bacterium]